MATKIRKPELPEFDREPYIFERTQVDDKGNETTEAFYSVAGRKQEFLFNYPDGRIITSLVEVRPNFVIAKCEVFLHADDTLPYRNAFATRELDTTTDVGRRFIECAETAAIGRALANAGIGADALLDDFDKHERMEASGSPLTQPKAPEPSPADKAMAALKGAKEGTEAKASKGPKPKQARKLKDEAAPVAQQEEKAETEQPAKEEPVQSEKKNTEAAEKPKTEEGAAAGEKDILQTVITSTQSKTLKGKTFAEAMSMVRDMARFKVFLLGLAENGTDEEKKAASILIVKFSSSKTAAA